MEEKIKELQEQALEKILELKDLKELEKIKETKFQKV